MIADSFAHLHAHSTYSMLDGKSDIDEMFAAAAEMGQPALAVTDHGNMFGAYEAYKAGRRHGINPIIGIEAYTAPGTTSRTERRRIQWGDGGGDDVSGGGAYHHQTLWAETSEGMRNLFRISSQSWMDGYYYKPRIDRELLNEHHEGIIATTGCPSGEVQTWLRLGHYDQALAAAAELADIFGPNNLYIELMDHGLTIEQRVRDGLLRIGKTLNLPFVATNDSHYVKQGDAAAHDAMLCVQSRSQIADTERFRFNGDGYYLKSSTEMRHLWRDLPEACDNTLLIAERCNVEFVEGADLMPRFPTPVGETEATWLVKEVERGLAARFAPNPVPGTHRDRAAYEVGVIRQMGFPGYFLVTADFVNWAKRQGIRVGPGRGSAAGSIVAYALGITELDPIEHGLLFERFLNPERVSPPDIDIDFDDTRRGEVIAYVTEKYGADKVSQIVTFGQIKAKAAIKDAARVLGLPFSAGERITKLVPPPVVGKDMPLAAVFQPDHPRYREGKELRDDTATNPETKQVIDIALGLEGVKRSHGVHAAGIILGAEPLVDHIPIMRREADGAIITQFDQKTCETLGLLKMDFLGLRNLAIIEEALNLIEQRTGGRPNLETLPFDDPATYRLLSQGDTLGVFQLDGEQMRALLRAMQPDTFGDISAVLALYRPGPMGANAHLEYADRKNGRKPATPIHPELAEALGGILAETYGLIVYQEQVMTIAQQLAGYSLGEADLLRRAMGKKDTKVLEGEFGRFSEGMTGRGYSPQAVRALWDVLLPFSDYAFNKAHSAAYGVVSYYTAYLKANYRAEYMAALLTSVESDKDKTALYLDECRRAGIRVLPPDVNESGVNYTPVDGETVRVGLGAIRNVGAGLAATIVERRPEGGWRTLTRFVESLSDAGLNKRALESAIKAGAFDTVHPNRAALHHIHTDVADQVAQARKNIARNQGDLFAAAGAEPVGEIAPPDMPDWPRLARLSAEREMLGQYVSDHPLRGRQHLLSGHATGSIANLFPPGGPPSRGERQVTAAGVITSVTLKRTRKGDTYAVCTLEDTTGQAEITAFPSQYGRDPELWAPDEVVAVKCRPDVRDNGGYTLIAAAARRLNLPQGDEPETGDGGGEPVLHLWLWEAECTPQVVSQVKTVLLNHPGRTPVQMTVRDGASSTRLALPGTLSVSLDGAVVSDLCGLLGDGRATAGTTTPP